jgi:hypothetical protein
MNLIMGASRPQSALLSLNISCDHHRSKATLDAYFPSYIPVRSYAPTLMARSTEIRRMANRAPSCTSTLRVASSRPSSAKSAHQMSHCCGPKVQHLITPMPRYGRRANLKLAMWGRSVLQVADMIGMTVRGTRRCSGWPHYGWGLTRQRSAQVQEAAHRRCGAGSARGAAGP